MKKKLSGKDTVDKSKVIKKFRWYQFLLVTWFQSETQTIFFKKVKAAHVQRHNKQISF